MMPARPAPRSTVRPTRDQLDVARDLHSAAIHLLRVARRTDAAAGLSAQRLSAMSVIVFSGPVTIGDLANAEQVAAPTMTRLVQALERNGLVRRERDSDDRRTVFVVATQKGRKLLAEGRERRVQLVAEMLNELRPTELTQLAAGIGALRRALDVANARRRAAPGGR